MVNWDFKEIWKGQECFIIGGGPSLSNFPFKILKPFLTIGCNNSYELGTDIVKVLAFGDTPWFKEHEKNLKAFTNPIFTNSKRIRPSHPWVTVIRRENRGLHKDALGWNCNTGAMAINLAILFGVTKIYLLGFDMKAQVDNNWYSEKKESVGKVIFDQHLDGFKTLYRDWKSKFSNVEIINITDDSDLNLFPKIGIKEFFKERIKDENI